MKILIISSHPDDIEFSMGATLAKLIGFDIEIHVFSDSADIKGNDGIQQEVFDSIQGVYGLDCTVHKYPTMHFRENYQDIRDDIFKIKQEFDPDVVYCKSPNGLHPDHQVIGEACESIFLECSVYAMEGLRDGHVQPINKWEIIDDEELNAKIKAIGCYRSQEKRHYSNIKTVEAIARFRGGQVGVEYAEGFEVLREVS